MFFRLGRRVFGWVVFVGLLALTIGWLAGGGRLAKEIADRFSSSAQAKVDRILKELEAENPKAAAELTRLREDNEIRLAVEAALLESNYRGGLAEVQRLADQQAKSDRMAYQIRVAQLAADANLLPTPDERNNFLWAHATSLELLAADPKAQEEYFHHLDRATSAGGTDWRMARANSMAMIVVDFLRQSGSPKELLRYYEEEQEWLDELLIDVLAVAEAKDGEKLIPEVVQIAYDYRPHFRKAAKDDELGAVAFFMFLEYGEVIVRAVSRGIPLEEVLDVIFANGNFLDTDLGAKTPVQMAEELLFIRNQKPSVWKAARMSAMALRLNKDVPNLSDELLEKYGADDVVALLYAGYEEEIVFAADCLTKFGDLAIYILSKYSESATFRQALITPGVGPRIIPYVARFEEAGLDRWEDSQKWLDKYFAPDGTPIDPEWWTTIPGGAAANVARNWVKGYPNEWSELGWGALDVADAALLVASFGSSSAVTTSAKSGAKQVGRTVVKRQVVGATKRAVKEAAKKGSRAAARVKPVSLLRRAVQSRTIGWVAQRGRKIWRAVNRVVVQPARKVAQMTRDAGKKLYGAWRSVSPRTRRIVYRSLLAVGLFVTITQRTLPALPQIGEAAGAFAGRVVKETASALAAGLGAALRELSGGVIDSAAEAVGWTVYLVVLAILLGILWWFLPIRSGRLRHV